MNPYLLTHSGLRVDLLAPEPESVTLPDIAHALARICRYTGHVRALHYSVAQHSVLVAQHLRDQGHSAAIQAQGLLHDAHEAYTGDMASPIKRALLAIYDSGLAGATDSGWYGPALSPWASFETRHAASLRRRFRLPLELAGVVHAADLALLMAEKRDLMPPDAGDGWPAGVDPAPMRICAMRAELAEADFLAEAARLGVV